MDSAALGESIWAHLIAGVKRIGVKMNLDDISNNLELKLYIKYPIVNHPSPEQSQEWVIITSKYISDGCDPEEAGWKAALDIFEINPAIIRKSQADTIEALLALASKKVQSNGK